VIYTRKIVGSVICVYVTAEGDRGAWRQEAEKGRALGPD
jgi:hypothetical protein